MPNDHDRRPPSADTPRPLIDPGFTGPIPVVRSETNASTTQPPPRSTAHRADRAPVGGRRPTAVVDARAMLIQHPLARRVAALAAVVLIAAPFAAAARPTRSDAESQTPPMIVPVTESTTVGTAAPLLLNPGASQTTTSTISLDDLPVLQKPGSTAAQSVAVADTCTPYTVVSGDSWSYIADKVSVSTSDLLAANGATSKTLLLVGDSLCLPDGASAPTTNAPTTTSGTTTTTKSTTTTTVPATTYTAAEVERIIREVWPDELEDTALAIAIRESKLNPYAHNWCCYGLFQIYWDVHKKWLGAHGITSASQLYDPRVNSYVAYLVYQRSGNFSPWGM